MQEIKNDAAMSLQHQKDIVAAFFSIHPVTAKMFALNILFFKDKG